MNFLICSCTHSSFRTEAGQYSHAFLAEIPRLVPLFGVFPKFYCKDIGNPINIVSDCYRDNKEIANQECQCIDFSLKDRYIELVLVFILSRQGRLIGFSVAIIYLAT